MREDKLGDISMECFAPLRDNERYKKLLRDIEEFNTRTK